MPLVSLPRPRVRGWSLRLGALAGVDLYFHATFVALLAWLLVTELLRGGSVVAAASSLAFVIGIFACVVLHELGHALAARRYGIATRDITLYPIGGVARLDRLPSDPRQELVIAVAGPMVNVIIAAALFVVLWSVPATGALAFGSVESGALVPRLLLANLGLAVFNLLPAFPMDGGRALRALLSRRMGRVRATRTAARIGQGMAVLFALLGLFGAPMLLLIALFVWVAAEHEARAVEVDDVLRGLTVAGAMETRFHVLGPSDPISRARSLILASSQVDVPLIGPDGTYGGLLGPEDVARGLSRLGEQAPVGAVARHDVPCAGPDETLLAVLQRMASAPWRTVPVVDAHRQLVGMLSSENVIELVMFREAAAARPPPLPGMSLASR